MKSSTWAVDLLVKLARGELDGKELEQAKKLAKTNPDLAELLAVAGELDQTQKDRLASKISGQSLNQLAQRMFRDFRKKEDDAEFCRGVTIYDSKVLPLPEGVRPAVVDVRKLKYKLGEWKVELALYPITMDSFELMGQVTGLENNHQLEVTLQRGRRRFLVRADERSVFRFPRVPSSDYILSIMADGKVLGRIDLKL